MSRTYKREYGCPKDCPCGRRESKKLTKIGKRRAIREKQAINQALKDQEDDQ